MKKCHLRRGSIYLNVSLWSARVIAIAELQSEVDVALPITNSTYATWLNSLQWLLYSAIIKEQNDLIITEPQEDVIQLANLNVSDNEAPIRFEDIYAVYADTTQLIKTSITSGFVFPDCFYKKNR